MKNFILGIIATLGSLVACNAIYDRGYSDGSKDEPNKEQKGLLKNKKIKNK